ncbi:tubby-like F-box protein 2 [Cajanus cajan]|uniref:Tubby-like F-box protein n=1 Tax=Cajanus cajan TaxID=3821 RepID=A0A151SEH0_CAJCA|nr:tubby-like F-box protein 2 [Cajanus cajan]KYP53183.1 Tubby-like F-box protein 5 [Cajanus cajan]
MSLRSIVRELKEMRDGIGSTSKRGAESKRRLSRTKSYVAPDVLVTPSELIQQGQWANLPSELLLDIIRRVEESETSWPARAVVVFCASVCKSWRSITKEIVKTPEQCGRITFPISLKQPGPRDSPIQCFIRRNKETSTYLLYFGLVPSENDSNKLLLAAKRIRRATGTDFVISLAADDFSRASSKYVGKLRSNFLGTKFTIHDSQPPHDAAFQQNCQSSRRFHSKQVSPRVPACSYIVSTVSYELNVLCTRGPRKMQCVMNSIPVSAIQEGGNAPTPTSFPQLFDEPFFPSPAIKKKVPITDLSSASYSEQPVLNQGSIEPLALKNKAPRWHEQLQCWCLNFKGRVSVASVKNFQLVAAVDPSHNISAEEQERVILQFGKIGKDIFTMDYCYPLSTFQAFAICLSSFDTKPACE